MKSISFLVDEIFSPGIESTNEKLISSYATKSDTSKFSSHATPKVIAWPMESIAVTFLYFLLSILIVFSSARIYTSHLLFKAMLHLSNNIFSRCSTRTSTNA